MVLLTDIPYKIHDIIIGVIRDRRYRHPRHLPD